MKTALSSTTLLISGCTVGPKYVQPDVADITLASPQAAQLNGAANSLPADWWTFFEDEALNRQIQAALAHNHDIRSAHANLLAASVHNTAAATADLYPRLNLGGFIGLFALRDADIGSAARAFSIAPALNYPLLQQGSARARLRAAEAGSQGALADYEQALLRAQEEVENAVTALVEQQRQLASLMQAAQHAQTALDIADARYRAGAGAGAGSYQSVLENQRTLYQLRHQLTDVETLSSVHVVTLYKALGWGKETI